jgi:hypothetical protein
VVVDDDLCCCIAYRSIVLSRLFRVRVEERFWIICCVAIHELNHFLFIVDIELCQELIIVLENVIIMNYNLL